MKKKATHLICRSHFSIVVKEKKNLHAFSIGTSLILMNAQATLAMRTQLVIIQWDLTYVCACGPGYSGDGFNCTGMHLN